MKRQCLWIGAIFYYPSVRALVRPATCAEVIGQEQVTKPLEEAAKTKKIGHAYLFAGSRGLGKTSVARIFASAIGCGETVSGVGKDVNRMGKGVSTFFFRQE